MALYVGLPFAAPSLMALGHERAARIIYTLYVPHCHQLPERSFFLFGDQAIYALEELPDEGQGTPQERRYFYGNEQIGFKTGFCERDIAIYGAILLGGMLYGPFRRRSRPLPFRYFLVLCMPMAVDGIGQLFRLWESTWVNRTITGALFGLALVWLAYPRVHEAMEDIRQGLAERLRP
jgi:uncharacterized membrane protein